MCSTTKTSKYASYMYVFVCVRSVVVMGIYGPPKLLASVDPKTFGGVVVF